MNMHPVLKKPLFLGVVLVTALSGVGRYAAAVTFGQPDSNAHPHVGTLLFKKQNVEGFFSYTGTLLSPTVMLTAGHCVESGRQPNEVTYVRFTENALEGKENYSTVDAWLNAEWILANEVIPHPQYDDYNQFPNTYDVGLVILSSPVYVSTYGALPVQGFLESVKINGNKDNRFTTVGYGMQGYIPALYADEFARYWATTRLIELNSHNNGADSSAKFTNNPGRVAGGTCYGDSGGPIFYQDTPIIAAIVSWGITPCIGVDYQYRIDTSTALNFIRSHLNAK